MRWLRYSFLLSIFVLGSCQTSPSFVENDAIVMTVVHRNKLFGSFTVRKETYIISPTGQGELSSVVPDGVDGRSAWSPDGQWIATVMGDNYDVYIMRRDGSQRTRITYQTKNHGGVAWSPDGLKLAYSGQNETLGNGIYIHNISCQLDNGVDCSSPPVFLVEDATASEWSSDGNYIVCNKNFVRNKARIVDIAEPERTVTLVSERFCANPHWSPTRNRIVVSCEVDTNTHTSAVYTVNADGSNLIQLTDPKVIDFREVYPRWSPDGDKLVFNSIRDINLGKDVCGFGCSDSILTSALYIMDVDGSNIVRLSLDDDEVILGYTWVP